MMINDEKGGGWVNKSEFWGGGEGAIVEGNTISQYL